MVSGTGFAKMKNPQSSPLVNKSLTGGKKAKFRNVLLWGLYL